MAGRVAPVHVSDRREDALSVPRTVGQTIVAPQQSVIEDVVGFEPHLILAEDCEGAILPALALGQVHPEGVGEGICRTILVLPRPSLCLLTSQQGRTGSCVPKQD